VTTETKLEKQIREAKESGRYATHAEIDHALRLDEGTSNLVLDRLRKRGKKA